MFFRSFVPPPSLRPFVRRFEIVQLDFAGAGEPPVKPYWPRPACFLSFYPRSLQRVDNPADGSSRVKPRAVLIGQATVVTDRQFTGPQFMVVQAEFMPGALQRLTGLRMTELTDTFVDAEAVFGAEVRRVSGLLTSTDDHDAMIRALTDFLQCQVSRLRRVAAPLDHLASAMLASGRRCTSGSLARSASLSAKQLYRGFLECTGVGPCLFQRIARLDRVMRYKNAHPHLGWSAIACDFDYCDYQHLVRDFRQFTLLTPNRFYERERCAPERSFGYAEKLLWTLTDEPGHA